MMNCQKVCMDDKKYGWHIVKVWYNVYKLIIEIDYEENSNNNIDYE